MCEDVNPEIPGFEPSNPGLSGLRKKSGIPGFWIPGLKSLMQSLEEQETALRCVLGN
jgi:hypothetical protein